MNIKYGLVSAICMICLKASGSPLFTERVSVNPATGAESDGAVSSPNISADGCIVVFQSSSTTLADAKFGITSSSPAQIYAVDRCASPHTIELISVTNDGSAAATGTAKFPNVSADGRYVAFYSNASNLPAGSGTTNYGLIFIRDRIAQTTTSPLESWRASATLYTNTSKPYMSSDAKYLALDFVAAAIPHNLYRFDLSTSPPTLEAACPAAAKSGSGPCENAVISADGSAVLFDTNYPVASTDSNTTNDVYAFRTSAMNWELASSNPDGGAANGDVGFNGSVAASQDGHIVVFHNYDGRNLDNGARTILSKDLITGELSAVTLNGQTVTMDPPTTLAVSANGQRIGFTPNTVYPIVHFQQDALVFDAPTQRLVSVCRSSQGAYGNADCSQTSLSADGNWAVFFSYATNLASGTTNSSGNIFVTAVSPNFDLLFVDGFEALN